MLSCFRIYIYQGCKGRCRKGARHCQGRHDPGESAGGVTPLQECLKRKFQVKSAQWKKRFRYLRDLHVLKSIKNQAKVVAPLVKYDIPCYEGR